MEPEKEFGRCDPVVALERSLFMAECRINYRRVSAGREEYGV